MTDTGTQPSSTASNMRYMFSSDDSEPSVVERIPIKLEPDHLRYLECDFETMDLIQKEMGIALWGQGNPWAQLTKDHHAVAQSLAYFLQRDSPGITAGEVARMPYFKLQNMNYILGRMNMLWGVTMVAEEPDVPKDGDANEPTPLHPVTDSDPNGSSGSETSGPTVEPGMD